jgi:hypothetical protein
MHFIAVKHCFLTLHFKRLTPLLAVPAALLLGQGQAKAILNVNIFDDGPNLKVTVQGSLSQLGTPGSLLGCSYDGLLLGQSPSGSALCTGPKITGPRFSLSGPLGFGGNGHLLGADQVQGPGFTMVTQSYTNLSAPNILPSYVMDSTYSLNQPIFSSATFNGKSLASEGFTATGLVGTWTIDGTSESINVYIGPTATPGPLPLFGAGAAFGWSRKLRRRIGTAGNTPPQA